ncbi:putative bifunctional diguanylate cyclase/phosphodiesterase [Pontibacter sp. JAM-7]|uniref:putative bifunctional diguanylate cyclase/phosphodiesterase n=1 Tax=Pontibacter sp. JAM-7 TaxID=3366581 RepID=UPI003AF6C876
MNLLPQLLAHSLNLILLLIVAGVSLWLIWYACRQVRLAQRRKAQTHKKSIDLSLLNNQVQGVLLCNEQGEMVCNSFIHQLLGWPTGTPQPLEIMYAVLQPVHYRELMEAFQQRRFISLPVTLGKLEFLLQGQPLRQKDAAGNGYIIRLMPLTEKRLNPNFERLCRHINDIEDGAVIVDLDLNICAVNRCFSQLTGYSAADVLSRSLTLLRSTDNSENFYPSLWQQIRDCGHWSGKVWSCGRDGQKFRHRLTVSEILNDQGVATHYLGVYGELAEPTSANLMSGDALSLAAEHKRLDILFQQRLQQADEFNLILLNINRFSRIQQTQSWAAAQEVLQHLRLRLQDACSAQDAIGRSGRDEFIVLCPASEEYTQGLLREIIRRVQQPIKLDELSVFISVSLGVARYPDHAVDFSSLNNAAGIALRSVTPGENRIGYYCETLGQEAAKNLKMESLLWHAIEQGELTLHYQPIFNTHCEMVKAEALLRWHSPELGVVSPGEFIPVAEQSSLIDKLGFWVMHEACRQQVVWLEMGLAIPVAVNISSRQLRDAAFPERLRRATRMHGVSPDLFQLEITESALMRQMDAGAEVLDTLCQQGFSIAIDDFGTGYSSLAYLQRFPAEVLKIDRSFIRDITVNKDTRILDSIIQMGCSLQKTLVVEGVENSSQLLYLQSRGCQLFQGFLLAKPMPADQLVEKYRSGELLVGAQLQITPTKAEQGNLQLVPV